MSQLMLPELPPFWAGVRIGDLADIAYGKGLREDDRTGYGGVNVYGSGGIVGEHDEALHPGPSIIIGRKGSVGSVYYEPDSFWCIDTAFYLEKISEAVNVEYLAYILDFINLSRLSITVGVPGINRTDLSNEKVPVPPLAEQARIVAILRQADELRRLRQQAQEKAQRLLASMYREMFSPEVAKSEGWPETTISQLGEVSYGLTVNRTRREATPQYPYLRVANIFRWEVNLDDVSTIGTLEGDLEKYTLQTGDVLVVEGHANPTELGRAAVWQGESKTYLHQNHLLRIRPYPEKATANYIAGYLNSVAGREYMLRYGKTSSGLNTINSTVLGDLPVFQPSLAVQQSFDEKVTQFNVIIEEIQGSQLRFEDMFQALLTRAFNGRLTSEWRQKHQSELEDSQLEITSVGKKEPETQDFDLSNDTERREFDELVHKAMPSVTNQIAKAITAPIAEKIAEDLRGGALDALTTLVQPILEDYQAAVNASFLRAFQEISRTILTTIAEDTSTKLVSSLNLPTDTVELVKRLSQLAALTQKTPNKSHPRYSLLRELSDDQYQTYLASLAYDGYFLAANLSEQLPLPSHLIAQSLRVLAAIGLIMELNLPVSSGNATVYQSVYRAFNDSDDQMGNDLLLLEESGK